MPQLDGEVTLPHGEVAKLPVGSIVWLWEGGRVDGSPLVVIPGAKLTQIALLPERADGQEPGGDPVSAWGNEFALVSKGKGKLPTHGTAQRTSEEWRRTHKTHSAATWSNSVNGHFFTLGWSKSKWQILEMADGSAIPTMAALFGPDSNSVKYEMPQLEALLAKHDVNVAAHADTLRQRAHLLADDSGSTARDKIIIANKGLMLQAIQELKADGSPDAAAKLGTVLEQVLPKLQWKKVR